MNEILIGVGVGLLLIFVAVISGALFLVKIVRSGNRPVQQPAAAPTQPRTFKEVILPYTPWLIGISIVVVGALVYHFYQSLTLGNLVLWLSGLLFAGIAVYGMKFSGDGSKWFTRIAGAAIAVVLLSGLLFGEKASEVGAKIRKDAIEKALSEGKSTKEDAPSDKPLETLPQGRVWENISFVWDERNPDGTIPIFARSRIVRLEKHCTIMYSDLRGRKYGTDYGILYLNNNGEWVPHVDGENVTSYEVRAFVTKTNIKELTYRHSCR